MKKILFIVLTMIAMRLHGAEQEEHHEYLSDPYPKIRFLCYLSYNSPYEGSFYDQILFSITGIFGL